MSYGLLLFSLLMFFYFSYKWIKYDKTYDSSLNAIGIVFYSIIIFFLWSFPIDGGAKLFVVLVKFYFLYIQKHVIIGKIKFQNYNIQSKTKWNFLFIFHIYFSIIQFFCFYLISRIEITSYPTIIELFTTNWFGPLNGLLSIAIVVTQIFVTWIEKRDRKRKNSIVMVILLVPALLLSMGIIQYQPLLIFLIACYFTIPLTMGIVEARFLNLFLKGITAFDLEIEKTIKNLSNSDNKKVQMKILMELLETDETLKKYLFEKNYLSPKKRKIIKELKEMINLEEQPV